MTIKKIFVSLLLMVLLFGLTACKPKQPQPATLDTRYTDELKLQTSFVGKEFIKDGIGEVKLNRAIDGDTIHVRPNDQVDYTNVSIRFLAINTPESTGRVEPWGHAASKFVADILDNAVSIVLEADGDRQDSTGRYLAFVWYKSTENADYRLINLEIVENAYSRFTLGQNKYYDSFMSAHKKTESTKLRVYGELDPNFNYSKDLVELSIAYLLANPEEFGVGTRFKMKVQIVRMVGQNFYLQDYNETEIDGQLTRGHIYAFTGYGTAYSDFLEIGSVITMEAKFQYKGNYGTQLTDIKSVKLLKVEPLDILELDGASLTNGGASLEAYENQVVQVNNLKLTKVHQSDNDKEKNLYTLTFENSLGKVISVRLGAEVSQYSKDDLVVGSTYSVIGGVSPYEYAEGKFQIVVGEKNKSIDLIKK